MGTLFQRAAAFAARTMKQAAGVAVTYQRGATSVPMTLFLGRTIFVSDRHDGVRVEFGQMDLLIDPADMGALGDPRANDQCVLTLNGVTLTMEILPIPGEPAWRWSDGYRTRYRVHVKRQT